MGDGVGPLVGHCYAVGKRWLPSPATRSAPCSKRARASSHRTLDVPLPGCRPSPPRHTDRFSRFSCGLPPRAGALTVRPYAGKPRDRTGGSPGRRDRTLAPSDRAVRWGQSTVHGAPGQEPHRPWAADRDVRARFGGQGGVHPGRHAGPQSRVSARIRSSAAAADIWGPQFFEVQPRDTRHKVRVSASLPRADPDRSVRGTSASAVCGSKGDGGAAPA